MTKYLYNGDNKTITRYEDDAQAHLHAQIALRFSRSLMVFLYDQKDVDNMDLSGVKKLFF